jgi:N-acetylated-alpha-linked acidic dipeptidase
MPISYGDALPILRELRGPVAPEAWRGALPITYHLGAGPARVHLKVESDWNTVPAYDVIARIAGAERPDEWVIRGNHHDAWVNGAADPVSGTVALMAEARAIGELMKGGWRPKRTIVYAAWDGEEPGLLGSTEWVETHADELARKAVVYVNSDGNGRGFLGVGGSHTLERFVNELAADVVDPERGVSVLERARAARLVRGTTEERKEARDRPDLAIAALGSGSDYTPFLQHAGVATLNVGYGGEDGGGSYHSIYDSFSHYTRFGDPSFAYGIALAQTTGRAVLRFADADILPLEFTQLSGAIDKYLREISKLADDMREETREKNRLIADRSLLLVADPAKSYVVPKAEEPVPYLNFAPLQNAGARLQESARAYGRALAGLADAPGSLTPDRQQALDDLLRLTERAMTREEGLPGRPWFKHQIYAPGFYTGYGVKTLPGVREAIEQRRWTEAAAQVEVVASTLDGVALAVDRATAAIGPAANTGAR